MMPQTTLSLAMLAAGAQSLSSCPSDIPLSCHNTTAVENTCCFNYPGGAFMLTQFWDTNPSTGPTDSWTVHGLWPDNCDGSYESFCDPSREYSNISAILESQGRSELLSYMHEYWVDIDGDDESFWAHEWNKHGTCINTIEPRCYQDYEPQEEVGEYFAQTVELFKSLDTYKALADAGITPDESKSYSLSDVLAALKEMHGKDAVVLCSDGALEQAYYYFDVKGNAIDGTYKAASPLSESDCPDSVQYLPKSG